MSSLIDIYPAPDHVADTCAVVDAKFRQVLTTIAAALEDGIRAVKDNDNHTAAEFWERVHIKGTTVLGEMAYWHGILQAKAPELLTDRITAAGSGLTAHQDGTVTVDA